MPRFSHEKPALLWTAEPLASTKSEAMTATHPIRGREEGWLFGGPGTGQAFAAIVLAERPDSARPFTLTTPAFWQFEALRGLAPRVGGPQYDMVTRWGRFTGRDMLFREMDGSVRTCVVFRNTFETSEFALGGFYCAPGRQSADAGPLACMIDKLQIRPGERKSTALGYLTARAANPPGCSSSTYYEPGSRRMVRDSRGGFVRMEGGSSDYPLWSR